MLSPEVKQSKHPIQALREHTECPIANNVYITVMQHSFAHGERRHARASPNRSPPRKGFGADAKCAKELFVCSSNHTCRETETPVRGESGYVAVPILLPNRGASFPLHQMHEAAARQRSTNCDIGAGWPVRLEVTLEIQ